MQQASQQKTGFAEEENDCKHNVIFNSCVPPFGGESESSAAADPIGRTPYAGLIAPCVSRKACPGVVLRLTEHLPRIRGRALLRPLPAGSAACQPLLQPCKDILGLLCWFL